MKNFRYILTAIALIATLSCTKQIDETGTISPLDATIDITINIEDQLSSTTQTRIIDQMETAEFPATWRYYYVFMFDRFGYQISGTYKYGTSRSGRTVETTDEMPPAMAFSNIRLIYEPKIVTILSNDQLVHSDGKSLNSLSYSELESGVIFSIPNGATRANLQLLPLFDQIDILEHIETNLGNDVTDYINTPLGIALTPRPKIACVQLPKLSAAQLVDNDLNNPNPPMGQIKQFKIYGIYLDGINVQYSFTGPTKDYRTMDGDHADFLPAYSDALRLYYDRSCDDNINVTSIEENGIQVAYPSQAVGDYVWKYPVIEGMVRTSAYYTEYNIQNLVVHLNVTFYDGEHGETNNKDGYITVSKYYYGSEELVAFQGGGVYTIGGVDEHGEPLGIVFELEDVRPHANDYRYPYITNVSLSEDIGPGWGLGGNTNGSLPD